ncbi:MAG: S46 family peptidase, partial [Verrucomicrobiota bacterium]
MSLPTTPPKKKLPLAKLVGSALQIVRMAEERGKPDAQRDPAYQERNWVRMEQSQKSITTGYHKKVDEALL